MKIDKNTKILIAGLGLMGGSYAEALTRRGFEVGALARRQEAIDFALEKGIISHGRSPRHGPRFDFLPAGDLRIPWAGRRRCCRPAA